MTHYITLLTFFFGWALNEALDCTILLISVRNKWRSIIYISLASALIFQWAATIMSAIGSSNLRAVVDDSYAGDFEYYWESSGMIFSMLARCGYILATVRMVLAVFPGLQAVKVAIALITSLALAGSLWYLERIMNFYQMEHDEYLEYLAKHDVELIEGEASELSSHFLESHMISLGFETITMTAFMLLTKIPFLLVIFKRLNVESTEMIKTVFTTRSTIRIFISCVWSIVEGVFTIVLTPQTLTQAVTLYSELFQLYTLSLLAFQGSGDIIKMYTMSSSKNVDKTQTKQPSSNVASVAKRSQNTLSCPA